MTRRFYKNGDPGTTLSTGINAAVTSITVANAGSFPASTPFSVIIEKGTANVEICLVTAVVGNVLTVTRGYNSTTAISHGNGVPITSGVIALDLDDAAAHVAATSGVHGVSSTLVGLTDVQTLTNKTLTAPVETQTSITSGSATPALTVKNTVAGNKTFSSLNAAGSETANIDSTGKFTVNSLGAASTDTALSVKYSGTEYFSVVSNGAVAAKCSSLYPGLTVRAFDLASDGTNAVVVQKFDGTQMGSLTNLGALTLSGAIGAPSFSGAVVFKSFANEAAASVSPVATVVYLTAPTGAGYTAGLFESLGGGVWAPLQRNHDGFANLEANPAYTTPTTGTDTSITLGSLTVPAWSSKALVSWAINGMVTSTTEPTVTAQLKIGTAGGPARNVHGPATATGRFSIAHNHSLTSVPTGTQSVTILFHWTAGANTFSIDATNSNVSANITFLP